MMEHSELATRSHHTYRINVNGTMDGTHTRDPVGYSRYGQAWESNVFVRLENIGEDVVKNPWIIVGGKRNWRSLEAILGQIIAEDMSEGEKARTTWEFARHHRYHFTTGDDEVKDTVKMLNVYGYTLCWDEAYTLGNLWQAAGLKIRRGMPHGHCTTEVFFDGRYHLLDSDEHLLVLLRDNETIGSEEDIARDHDLMKRAHAYGILQRESRETSERAASIFVHTGVRAGGRPFIGGHRMDLTLRPGEALVWEWVDRGKYHGYRKRPPLLANGRLQYSPRMDASFEQWAQSAVNLRPAAAGLEPADPAVESVLSYRIDSPYVIVGGRVELSLAGGDCMVEVSTDGEQWDEVAALSQTGEHSVSIDACFQPHTPARYDCHLRLRGTGLAVTRLFSEMDLQMAPLSLPALELGENHIVYSDETGGERRVQITHGWQERSDCRPPPAPGAPRFPETGAEVTGTQFTFAWEPAESAVDYHFQLSAVADMKYCLSPTFDKLISKTPAKGTAAWRIPHEGLLNPGRTYYWRVRARSAQGIWGPWSAVWSFVPQAPGVPLDVRIETDWEKRALRLHWQPNPQGRAAERYEVYGSDERGFTASREPYLVLVGRDQKKATFPANLLATTGETSLVVAGPDVLEEPGGRCFYRVVAVDADGIRSGPSDYAEAPRPFIYSRPPEQVIAGEPSTHPLRVLCSIGDLRAVSDGPKRYVSAFREADELRFILDEGPDWLRLEQKTGILTITPAAQHVGTHTVTIRVQNGQGGADVQGFDLRVVAGGSR